MESFEHSQDFHVHNHSVILNPVHVVQRSGDGRGDRLIACPLLYCCVEQWCMVVIVTGYVLFVTLQYDVIFTFPKQRFGEVC